MVVKNGLPDALFDDTTPRLSYLGLHNPEINWKPAPLKGLTYLEIRTPGENASPSFAVWLDALEEMPRPRLKALTLHSASSMIAP